MEILDIVDEEGNPTGQTVEREIAHRDGVRHRTSHVWLARRKEGRVQLLLQKRCMTKDSYPGCYDISSAGHIPAGVDYIPSAIRELKEELGVEISPDQFIDCGKKKKDTDKIFHGRPFYDRQVSKVFLVWLDLPENQFVPQPEEIDSVRWMDYLELKQAVADHSFLNCVDPKELLMLEPHLNL